MPKLYFWPATCAITIHVILEEIGLPYEDERVDLNAKQQFSAEFLKINPKGKVPALVRDDGSVLTEVPAIAFWLSLTNPRAKLLGSDIETRVRTLEVMDYIAATIHMQGAARAWRPAGFSTHQTGHEEIRARGKDIVLHGLEVVSSTLASRDWLAGDDYSIADASLFFIEYWVKEKVEWNMPNNIEAHYRRMLVRPAVQRALRAEGLA
jgi:glutathione S-transferase